MIEKYNPRKRWYKCLAMVLVIAMSVSLLSGCGQKGTETQTDPAAQTEQAAGQKVVEDGVQSAASTLAKRSEETEDLLEQLGRAAEKEDAGEMHTLAHALSDKLTETKEDTKQWLAAQQEMAKDLSGDAAKTLEERQKVFEQELEAGEKEAEETLNKLGEALEKGDMEEVSAEAARLQELLVKKEEPKTYGDTLPGEVPVNEAEEQAYEEEKPEDTKAQETSEDSDNAAAISLSADEEQKLLVTEGDTALNERIKQKAEELGTPLAVYNYLKNNIGYEYYYGSRKGAAGTLDAMGGNDLDQASLLIAMLRHLGYPAQYVRGDILLTEEQALSLTGADTFRQAADVLAANGTPVTRLTRGEEIVYIRMEHVWVRAYIPYTDYRGAGNAGGDSLWIDLDTGIKAYEAADNIYDTLEEQGFSEEAETAARAGNVEQMESLLEQWQEKLESQDLSETYARKRIIRQEELSYLPLSLQYSVEKESRTFEQVADTEKDRVSFEVNGEVLAGFAASELQGKNILLSFRPASGADQAIYDSYGSIFDVPAYAVYMKPVLLIDNEVAAEGESYLESTLGTKGSLTINLTSGGRNASVSNDITTGSMYAVTLDSQTITAEELQSVYDEAAALKDSVTEDNVYSEGYLGKLLALAGKLYFVQVDIADTMAADMYDVVSTRSLSEGITGYEVRTSSLYGRITSLSEGSLYIDVDTDSHGVVSLDGEEDVTREYMSSTGMMSSLYESTVWEELTGYESVSTISILAKAQEENVEVLLLSSLNMDTELEKLNTDEATRQTVINAVNSGKVVTIPAEEITIGNWTGTGYIVTNPETGAGEYMISGGLNGGSTSDEVTLAYMVDIGLTIWDMIEALLMISNAITALAAAGGAVAGGVLLVLGVVALGFAMYSYVKTVEMMCAYASGDEEAGQELIKDMWLNIVLAIGFNIASAISKPIINIVLKNKLVRDFGKDFIEKMLRNIDITDLGKYVKQLRKMNISDDVIREFAEKYGKAGLDWLLSKKGFGLSDDILRKLLKAGNLDDFTDDILRVIKNSDGYADDIVEQVLKYGDDAAEAIGKYGDDAAKVIKDYGDDAVKDLKSGATPKEVANIQKYIKDIVDGAGNVNMAQMDKIRLAIQNGTFNSREIKLLSKKMSKLGITEAYESAMKNIDFGKYLKNIKGNPPANMLDPHAHHILFKTGNGATQQELVKEGQEILRKYGIDPIVGEENLIWAPNRVAGQHDIAALEKVVNGLKAVDKAGGDYDDIVDVLNMFGRIASER